MRNSFQLQTKKNTHITDRVGQLMGRMMRHQDGQQPAPSRSASMSSRKLLKTEDSG
ncbi:hypothetical protein LV779_15895 [Streptomyces thinghirensis]|nr:hypothetical protein [Streptomyces thinghirensis]